MSFNAKVIEKFSSIILEDKDTTYTVSEMKKILSEVYKEIKNDNSNDVNIKNNRRGSKKRTDNDRPKKAPSAYNIFIKQKMLELKESDSSISPKDLMKVASTYWSKLSEDEKKSFKDAIIH